MYLDSQQAKLFIKVDGVIGDRRRICAFCNSTIHGAEKVVETTRKLRRGPYFPQLAHLQSSIGKIDTMGRAVVCLPCFHQLLRQWNTYENKHIPMSKRVYKHVSDKGVKNYQETRASEIRAEAEKRAFAIQTNQEHIVKRAFERLTKRLDAQEDIIQQSEECIEQLDRKLALCTKGEHWKISREIKKHEKIISVAEARIEDEEDKEELIRKETKSLLNVYRNNQSLFQAVSEPNLFQGNFEHQEETPVVFEDYTDRVSADEVERSQSDHLTFDTVDSSAEMDRNQQFTEYEHNYNDNGGYTVVKTVRISQSDDESDSSRSRAHVANDGYSRDVWSTVEDWREYEQNGHEPARDKADWHMTKEIIYPAQSNEVESFPEDEWSKLFDKERNEYENEAESSTKVRSSVMWTPKRDHESRGDMEWRRDEDEVVEREEQQLEESEYTDDSDDEREQIYQINTHPSNDEHFQRHDISDHHNVARDMSFNTSWENNGYDHHVRSEADVDPWDTIQIEKEREKRSQVQHSETQDNYNPHNDVTDEGDYTHEYDQDNSERGNEEIISPRRLDPGRFSEFTKSSHTPEPAKEQSLNRQRSRDTTTKPSEQHNGTAQQFERRNDVKIVESSSYLSDDNATYTQPKSLSYDPLEPLRKNRNVHVRHLSVEEEEWERKHLSPKRLDQTKWFNFVNENSRNMQPDVKSTYPVQHNFDVQEQNNRPTEFYGTRSSVSDERQTERAASGNTNSSFSANQYNTDHEGYRNRLNDPSDAKPSSNSEGLHEIHVERSPALKRLMKQDEISEEPVRRVTTKASLQHSPWDDVESHTTRRDSGVRNKQEDEIVSDKNVGKLDLKRWSSEVERNRSFEVKSTEPLYNHHNDDKTRSPAPLKQKSLTTSKDTNKDEVVIINRNQSPRKAGDVYISESNNDSTSQNRSVSPSLKYKEKINFSDESNSSRSKATATPASRVQYYKGSVIIEDEPSSMNQDDDYLNRKRVGKVNLGLWERNDSTQHSTNGLSSTAKVSSTYDSRSQSISPKDRQSSLNMNGGMPQSVDDGQRFLANKTSSKEKSYNAGQERSQTNSQETHINHRSFNKSMSEDELAWEKRFSKHYERKVSVEMPEEQVVQRKVSDHRIPRLSGDNVDKNNNHINFGKISLDEDEVRRVRNGGKRTNQTNEDAYITSTTSNERNHVNRQISSTTRPNQTTKYAVEPSGDISQLTEEEQAWEQKTSRPGRIDLSKFSHFK